MFNMLEVHIMKYSVHKQHGLTHRLNLLIKRLCQLVIIDMFQMFLLLVAFDVIAMPKVPKHLRVHKRIMKLCYMFLSKSWIICLKYKLFLSSKTFPSGEMYQAGEITPGWWDLYYIAYERLIPI